MRSGEKTYQLPGACYEIDFRCAYEVLRLCVRRRGVRVRKKCTLQHAPNKGRKWTCDFSGHSGMRSHFLVQGIHQCSTSMPSTSSVLCQMSSRGGRCRSASIMLRIRGVITPNLGLAWYCVGEALLCQSSGSYYNNLLVHVVSPIVSLTEGGGFRRFVTAREIYDYSRYYVTGLRRPSTD